MTTVGIISLALGFFFLYIYVTKIKGQSGGKLNSASKLRELQAKKEAQRDEGLSIEDVEAGGVVHLEGVGLRSESFDAQVTARHVHKFGSTRTYELEADRGGKKVYIGIEKDDELCVDVTLAEPSLQSLGIGPRDIDQFHDQQTLTYDGTEFHASEYGRGVFCRDGNELHKEDYEYWDFESKDEEQYLSLVRWEDGSVEASYSVDVSPTMITVYSLSA